MPQITHDTDDFSGSYVPEKSGRDLFSDWIFVRPVASGEGFR